MVEIELSVLGEQCLSRRIPSQDILAVQVEAWCRARNREGARIRRKMGHHYPLRCSKNRCREQRDASTRRLTSRDSSLRSKAGRSRCRTDDEMAAAGA